MQPTAFISYSWDSFNEWNEQNELWVLNLADRLTKDRVTVILDKWSVQPGDLIPQFMEKAITDNDRVIIICTPRYKYSSDNRKGAVGYESNIISSLILQSADHRKFITVIKQGNESTSVPAGLMGKFHIYLDNPCTFEKHYQVLINAVHNSLQSEPILHFTTDSSGKLPVEKSRTLNLSFAFLQTITKAQIKEYIIHYKKMLQFNSFKAAGWFGLGICTLHYGLHDAAVMHLKKACELEKTNADYYYYLAVALCRGENPGSLNSNTINEVLHNLFTAIALNDEQAKYYVLLLILYYEYFTREEIIMAGYNKSEIIEKNIKEKYKDIDEIKRLLAVLKIENSAILRVV